MRVQFIEEDELEKVLFGFFIFKINKFVEQRFFNSSISYLVWEESIQLQFSLTVYSKIK